MAQAQVVAATSAGVVVGLHWREPDRTHENELYQVVRLRDGMVVDMEDHVDRGKALKAVGAAA